jgi:ATP-binding cassette subfamily B protein
MGFARADALVLSGFIAADVVVETLKQIWLAMSLALLMDGIAQLNMAMIYRSLTLMAGCIALTTFVWSPLYYVFESSAHKITVRIRKSVFSHVESLPIGFFKDTHSGDLASRLTNDVRGAEQMYMNVLGGLFGNLLSAVAASVYMFWLEWRLALFVLAVSVAGTAINLIFGRIIRRLSQQVQERLADTTVKLTDMLAGLQVVKGFSLAELLLKGYRRSNQQVLRTSLRRTGANAVLDGLNVLVADLGLVGTIGFGAFLAMNGMTSFGVAFAMIQLSNPVRQFFRMAGPLVGEFQSSLASADRLFEVLDTPAEPERYSTPAAAGGSLIACSDVEFGYAGGDRVLDSLSLAADMGQVVALVGPSGGGKTTILKLLMGFYPAAAGGVSMAGRPLGEYSLAELRRLIAYVPQDAYLFAGTVAENIRQGKPDATMAEVEAAAKASNAHDFIMGFEQGYETLVGERGTHISGGQRQRIAIARAILKDAPILLLDEATSALDTESERLVQEALEKLMSGRTTVVVAHRLSTIQNADQILVIAGGKVAEAGRHDELLALPNGIYRRLHEQQFQTAEAAS